MSLKNQYDICIIGGGIAGLNTAYQLSKLKTNLSIALFEKSNKFGGRIQTYKNKVKGQSIIVNEGAGRFSEYHLHLISLLKNLGLDHKIAENPNKYQFIKNSKVIPKILEKRDKIIREIINYSKKDEQKIVQSMYLYDYIKFRLGNKKAELIKETFPYDGEVSKTNAYDAIRMFEKDFHPDTKHFTLIGGMHLIISKLVQELKKTNIKLFLNTNILDISKITTVNKSNNNFNIDLFTQTKDKKFIEKNIKCKILISAVPGSSLKQWFITKSLKKELNSINLIPLLRIYQMYKTKNNKSWFDNIPITITNNKVHYVIPINKKNGVIMSSYTDSRYAKKWNKNIIDNTLEKDLQKNLNITFKNQIEEENIPEAILTKYFYWNEGVAGWKKNIDSHAVSCKLIHPFANFYTCGENYSMFQAWSEGALETSNAVLTKLKQNPYVLDFLTKKNEKELSKLISKKLIGSGNKKITKEEVAKHNTRKSAWMIIEKKVYDVTKWIPIHPGGEIIMKGVGKDATKLFNGGQHPPYVKETILPKFYIGDLAK